MEAGKSLWVKGRLYVLINHKPPRFGEGLCQEMMMAFPCCENCYVKYLDEEGNPLPEVFERIFGEGATIVREPAPLTDTVKWIISRGAPHPIWPSVMVNGEKKEGRDGCVCPCHKRGSIVMH